MTAKLPSISVVVATYQRSHLLTEVLRPIFDDPATGEVIVVNDGSTDATREVLDDIATSEPRLRPIHQANAGREAARRAGIRAARFDVVLLLDDDVRAHPGLVSRHAGHHRSGGVLVEGYMPLWSPPGRRPSVQARLYSESYSEHCTQVERNSGEVLRQLWGGNVSLPLITALEIIDGPPFPASYCEDTHLGFLLAEAGLRGVFDKEARADHIHRRTYRQYLADAREQGKGRWWLHRIHHGALDPLEPEYFLRGIPGLGRSLILRFLPDRPCALARLAIIGSAFFRAVRSRRGEVAFARLTRRVAMYQGATEVAARFAGGRDGRRENTDHEI